MSGDRPTEREGRERIYLSPPHIGDSELRYVLEAFESNWIAPAGPHLSAFEDAFARTVGTDNALAVSSGTAALHLALRCAGVGPGDLVAVSTLTFVGGVSPVVYLGAEPVFIDSERDSWNMDPASLKHCLEDMEEREILPKALVVTHLYGQMANMEKIQDLCSRFGLFLIEDAAEALGAHSGGRAAGTLGDAGIYSFNGNKIITTSGGGMLVSSDARVIQEARELATQAREPAPHYEHRKLGYNYRLSNVLAAIGLGQLEHLENRVRARRRIFERYQSELSGLPGFEFMAEAPWSFHTRWLTTLTVDPEEAGVDGESIRLALAEPVNDNGTLYGIN